MNEIKYLALTNDLLNSFIDKNFYQKAVTILDKETLENMEMNISEKVLTKYAKTRKSLLTSRL